MQLKSIFGILLLFATTSAIAQFHDNLYRNSGNPYYWQNRKPDAAYWQQDVAYQIYAGIIEDTNMIDGMEVLTYWNNSPDTLNEVYFHLYQNAFIKGSHLHNLEAANHVKAHMGRKEAAGLGITINDLTVDGQVAKTVLDNTIMKVFLPAPLPPGKKVVFQMKFNTYYDRGSTRRRMQMYNAWGFMHYNGTQWYPKICVYDRMHGWDTYQHLNREFYGDYGTFDVTLNFPSNYIVEATGVLQNRSQVLPDTLREKLDIKNFANKKWEEAPSIVIPYKRGERKEWHYIANNVHDFAFTADPSYRIGVANWNGVECVALVQEPHASGWQNAAEYVTKIIKTFSTDIGMYCYPKIVAADAQDGMEYPMLTLDGGREPGYRGLFVHEIGHNWFYGQVGNNETYRAALDEGFTQFLTDWGVSSIDGDTAKLGLSPSKYRKHFADPVLVMDRSYLNQYTMAALNKNETPLNTHSDDFNSALNHGGGYGLVYFKTATMLRNLQLVLGDSLFKAALHHYFEQWKFCHPYFEDFRASVIQFTHNDLSWFFDEWFETTKTLDYSIGRISKADGEDNYSIAFRRKGEMQMPIDFTVTNKEGKNYNFYIPNTWYQKETDATILPKWYGWGKLYKNYAASVHVPGGIKKVRIDPSNRLADKVLTDNYKFRNLPVSPDAFKIKWDGGLNPQMDRRQYRLDVRPDLWWNSVDGIKAGVHFEGDYMFTLYQVDGAIWFNTHLLQEDRYKTTDGAGTFSTYSPINYTINYYSLASRNLPKLQLQINSRFLDGLWYQRGGFNWSLSDNNMIQAFGLSMWRNDAASANYFTAPQLWTLAAQPNSSINLLWRHTYSYLQGNGKYSLSARMPFMTDVFSYSYFQLEHLNTCYLDKLELRTRLFGRYGLGKTMPMESALYMAGASPEEQIDNKYTRSVGFVPADWTGISPYDLSHFQEGGGLNLRGYAGYFSPDYRSPGQLLGYAGRSGVSCSAEADFSRYIHLAPKFTRNWLKMNLYAFGDAGFMELSYFNYPDVYHITPSGTYWSSLHADAGLGMALTVKNWGVFEKGKPLTLRLDLPIFLNRTPYNNTNYASFRYVIGVNRAF
jgi:Peptidase family M1 domain